MNTSKYYDYTHHSPIDLEKDGCVFDDWKRSYGKASFARHSEGFLVFLEPHEIGTSDEYKEADPYSVEAYIRGDFQKRRIECTLEMVKEASSRLQTRPRILDLGCGQGHITAFINQQIAVAEVCGLDYSISAIRYANREYPGIDFVVASAYQCPYREGYFDIVVCNNLWEHVPDPLLLLNKIARVITPGGFLIISTPSRYRWGNLVNVLRGKSIQFMSEHHVTEYSVGQVIEQLRFGGFDVIKSFSKTFRSGNWKFEAAKKLFSVFASMTGSHHQLESTVFYLAQRTQKNSRDVSQ